MKTRTWLVAVAALAAFAGTAVADTLDEIKKRGELIVGMEIAYQPFEYFKDGKVIGYDIDIATKIAGHIGVKPKFVDTAWAGVIPSLYANKFDTIMSGMAITRERSEKVLFAMPYAESGSIVMIRAADAAAIKSPADLAGKSVGTQLGSPTDVLAKKLETKLKGEGKPGFKSYKLYEHYPESYLDLSNGRLDAVILSRTIAMVLMRDQPGRYAIVDGVQDIKVYAGYAFRKGDEPFVAIVNEVIGGMKASGELAELQKKWFGMTMETPNTIPEALP